MNRLYVGKKYELYDRSVTVILKVKEPEMKLRTLHGYFCSYVVVLHKAELFFL